MFATNIKRGRVSLAQEEKTLKDNAILSILDPVCTMKAQLVVRKVTDVIFFIEKRELGTIMEIVQTLQMRYMQQEVFIKNIEEMAHQMTCLF